MKSQFAPLAAGQLAGRVALVTGAGGGIGGAVARRFAGEGVRLVLVDRREEPLSSLARTLDGAEFLTWTGDLAQESDVRELFRQTLERFARVDIAVNAAGVLRQTPLEAIQQEEWDAVVGANLTSAFLVSRECCAPMKAQGWGKIVNFSSLAGQVGGILAGAHYSAAKAGVISLTRSLAKYLAPYGVRCNCIAPSGVDTDMLRVFSEEQQEVLVKGIPVGRFSQPEELAEVVLWLSSPASDYITGQTICFNGGAYFGG